MRLSSGRDVISNLPDDVRVHILSFLLTKDAFKTSILSSKWENLWTMVPILKFYPNNWANEDEEPGYMEFIEMVSMSHTSNIDRVHIYCTPQCNMSRLKACLSVLVERNVQEVVIKGYDKYLELPKSLFACKTLVTLELSSVIGPDDEPASIYFPCLKVLSIKLHHPYSALIQKLLCSSPLLENITIYAESGNSEGECPKLPVSLFPSKTLVTLRVHFVKLLDVPASVHFPCLKVLGVLLNSPSCVLTRKLFCSSPVLEDLSIFATYENPGGEYIYNITSPSLKKLYISFSHDYFNCVVNVDAPKLEFLDLKNAYSAHFITHSPALIVARLSYFNGRNNLVEKLTKLLNIVSSVKNLSLAGKLPEMVFGGALDIKWPDFANVTHLRLTIWDDFDFSRCFIFPKLKHLQLNVKDGFASKNLSDLLELAPNLVSLEFVKGFRESSKKFNSLEQRVPSCVRSCLKEVVVIDIDGSESEIFLIKYLLTNAQVLQKLTFKFSYKIREDPAKVDELIKKLDEKLDELESEIDNSSKNLERVFCK